MNKKTQPNASAKKDLKAKLSAQLHTALAEFKETINEKKLQKLVKKATKVLADGLQHNKKTTKPVSKKAVAKKDIPVKPVKKTGSKKSTAKKPAAQKTAKKK